MQQANRLAPAITQAEEALQQCSAQLSQVQNKINQERQKLAMLEQYHADYRNSFQTQAVQGLTSSAVQHYHQLINQLDNAIIQHHHLMRQTADHKQQLHKQWQIAYQRVQALKQLEQKYQQQAAYRQARIEQKDSDEFAARQHFSLKTKLAY